MITLCVVLFSPKDTNILWIFGHSLMMSFSLILRVGLSTIPVNEICLFWHTNDLQDWSDLFTISCGWFENTALAEMYDQFWLTHFYNLS